MPRTATTAEIRKRFKRRVRSAALKGFNVAPHYRILRVDQGPFVPLGHGAQVPEAPTGFGPSKFTETQQRDNPDLPMTRLVKDVLRAPQNLAVGIDPVTHNPLMWPVTLATLNGLKETFDVATARGVAFNLGMSHGNKQTGIIPTDELIAPIDAVIEENGVLWVSTYVTPEQAKFLCNPAMKVSVGVWDDWKDGLGNVYKSALIHVAVTDHPVVPGQGPFRRLANSQGNTMAGVQDFPRLVELISSLLPGELSLPEGTTEDDIVNTLEIIVTTLAGGTAEVASESAASETPGEGDAAAAAANAQSGGAGPMLNLGANADANLKAIADVINGGFKALNLRMDSIQAEKAQSAKATFEKRVTDLCVGGLPAAEGKRLLSLGAKHQYDLDLLPAPKVGGGLNTGGKARSLANGQSSGIATSGEMDVDSDEAVKERMRARGIDPAKFFPRIASRK